MPTALPVRRTLFVLVAAALVLSTFISAWQAGRANSRAEAEWQARQAEAALREQAQANEQQAWAFVKTRQAASRFIEERILGAARDAGTNNGPESNVTVCEAVDAAERAAQRDLRDQPLAETVVRLTLGRHYQRLGQLDQAIKQFHRAVELSRRELGPDNADTLTIAGFLGVAYATAGRFDEALREFEDTLPRLKARAWPGDPDLLHCLNNLAGVYQELGEFERAVALFTEALRLQMTNGAGRQDPLTLLTMSNLAAACYQAKNYEQAIHFFRESLDLCERAIGPHDVQTLDTRAALARALIRQEQFAAAEPLARASVLGSQQLPQAAWRTAYYQSLLGEALLGQARAPAGSDAERASKLAEAEQQLLAGYNGLANRPTPFPTKQGKYLTDTVRNLVAFYRESHKQNELAKWQAVLDASTTAESPTTTNKSGR